MNHDETPPKPIYVYVLTDPRYPDDVRYVGVTAYPQKRVKQHIQESKYGKRNYRTNWIQSLLYSGVEPIITIIDQTDNANWQQCEIGWIAHYRAIGCNLVNSTDGGEGARGVVRSEESRRKISIAKRGKKLSEAHKLKISYSSKNCSEETRRKISEAHMGKKYSDEHRRNISQGNKGRVCTIETRRKISEANRGKKANEETRRRLSEAGRNRTNSEETRRKISEANKGKVCTTQELERLSQMGKDASEANKIPILQYDKLGNFIQWWDSARSASNSLGIDRGDITKCCKKKYRTKSAGGYIWRYADDPLLGEMPAQLKLDLE